MKAQFTCNQLLRLCDKALRKLEPLSVRHIQIMTLRHKLVYERGRKKNAPCPADLCGMAENLKLV